MVKEMKTTKEQFLKYSKAVEPKSNHIKNMVLAFVVGGLICVVGQIFYDILELIFDKLTDEELSGYTTIIMIGIGVILTGVGVYDVLGRFAGAGSIIPITGFANSVVSPAMEYRDEGLVFGVMCNMFTIAGPIIVTSAIASSLVGLIYFIGGL